MRRLMAAGSRAISEETFLGVSLSAGLERAGLISEDVTLAEVKRVLLTDTARVLRTLFPDEPSPLLAMDRFREAVLVPRLSAQRKATMDAAWGQVRREDLQEVQVAKLCFLEVARVMELGAAEVYNLPVSWQRKESLVRTLYHMMKAQRGSADTLGFAGTLVQAGFPDEAVSVFRQLILETPVCANVTQRLALLHDLAREVRTLQGEARTELLGLIKLEIIKSAGALAEGSLVADLRHTGHVATLLRKAGFREEAAGVYRAFLDRPVREIEADYPEWKKGLVAVARLAAEILPEEIQPPFFMKLLKASEGMRAARSSQFFYTVDRLAEICRRKTLKRDLQGFGRFLESVIGSFEGWTPDLGKGPAGAVSSLLRLVPDIRQDRELSRRGVELFQRWLPFGGDNLYCRFESSLGLYHLGEMERARQVLQEAMGRESLGDSRIVIWLGETVMKSRLGAGSELFFDELAGAARRLPNPLDRSQALRELAVGLGKSGFQNKARLALTEAATAIETWDPPRGLEMAWAGATRAVRTAYRRAGIES